MRLKGCVGIFNVLTGTCAVLASLLAASLACATTYYVDATHGGDTAPGTSPETAWKTIAKVNSSSFSPGDSILLKRGERWREQLTVPSSGTAGKPIIFGDYSTGALPQINGANLLAGWTAEGTRYFVNAASKPKQVLQDGARLTNRADDDKVNLAPGEWTWSTADKRIYVRLNGDDNPSSHMVEATARLYGVLLNPKSYITVQKLNLVNAEVGGIVIFGGTNVIVSGVVAEDNYMYGINSYNAVAITNSAIRDSIIRNQGSSGIQLNGGDYWTVERNIIDNNGELSAEDWTAGIKTNSTNVANSIFQDNEVYSNSVSKPGTRGVGIWLDTAGLNNIIRRNRVYKNNSHGIMIEQTDNTQISYNLSFNNLGRGIYVSRKCRDNQIYNNTTYGNVTGISINGDYPPVPNNMIRNIVKNNISVGNTYYQLEAQFGGENDGTSGVGNVYVNNSFGPEGSNFILWGQGVKKSTYDDWETAPGNCKSRGCSKSMKADPKFIDAANNNFHLHSSSPAIDAGTDVGLTRDYSGTPIPQSRGIDLGAIEFVYDPPPVPQPPTSLRSLDVNP